MVVACNELSLLLYNIRTKLLTQSRDHLRQFRLNFCRSCDILLKLVTWGGETASRTIEIQGIQTYANSRHWDVVSQCNVCVEDLVAQQMISLMTTYAIEGLNLCQFVT